jgi:hypothetical protein
MLEIQNPVALIAEARRLHGMLGAVLDDLEARLSAPTLVVDETPLVRPDGRLTEAGIDAVYAEFAANSTNGEIAKKFDISLSGVVKRKAMWRRGER